MKLIFDCRKFMKFNRPGTRVAVFLLAVFTGMAGPVVGQSHAGESVYQSGVSIVDRSDSHAEPEERVASGDSLSGRIGFEEWQRQALKWPEIIRTENFSMSLGGRLQVRYAYLDPEDDSSNGSFSIRRARLSLKGDAYDHFRYAMQLELAGGSVNLLDANILYEMAPMATLWMGQGKAFFGRQQLTSSGSLNFVDRTVADSRFSAGRQTGIALVGQNREETFEYNLGIYNGTGINTANNNGKYMKVARIVFTPFGAYPPVESAHDHPDSPRLALGVSGLHTTTGTGANETDVARLNFESAFKLNGWSVTGEFYWEESNPSGLDAFNTTGGYIQAGYLFHDGKNEMVVRYAAISPDVDSNADTIETGVAFNHYLLEHRAKIQADVRNVERKALDTNDVEFRIQLQISL